jgi:CubicO group peptidase (beta-lactamase class C family)
MKNPYRIYLSLVVLAIMQLAFAQSSKSVTPKASGLSSDSLKIAAQKMQAYINAGTYPYIATMVLVDGKVIDRHNYGFNDKENELPVEDDAIFRIYSMSKPITAAGLMILYDEGLFSLDDPVAKYFPEFGKTLVYTPAGLVPQENPMTIRNLLTHTSGLTYGWDPHSYVDSLYRVERGNKRNEKNLQETIKALASLPLKYQPGTHYEYSLSIDVAGGIVEVLSGMSFDEFLRTKLFDPLKMEDTGFYVPEENKDRLARVYYKRGKAALSTPDNPGEDRFHTKPVMFSGGGGLVSTMDDYARFTTMLLNKGILDGVRVLKESTVDLILSNQFPEGAIGWEGKGYGLGGSYDPETGEYGWGGAASTSFVILPKQNMAIMAFTQLMPAIFSYSDAFVKAVKNAIIE